MFKPEDHHLPVLLMKSAKSPMESRSTRASLGWGAFARNLDPALEVGRGIALNGCAALGVSTADCDCDPVSLLTDDECDRLVFGLWTSLTFVVAAGLA
jgi:hypothetical protein